MIFVITSPCIDCKDGTCVDVCPVDCIYEGRRMFYIQPDECIGCGACESVCPVEAIWREDVLPDGLQGFVGENAEFFSLGGLGSPGSARLTGQVDFDTPTVERWPAPSAAAS